MKSVCQLASKLLNLCNVLLIAIRIEKQGVTVLV